MNNKILTSFQKKTHTVAKVAMIAMVGFAFVGCDGRTTQSLCDEATGPISGITGTYESYLRNQETFGVDRTRFTINAEKNSRKYSMKSTKDDGDEDTTYICNVGGHIVAETFDRRANGYWHADVFISQVGIHASPLLFDKERLDQAQIPNSVKILPPELENLLGKFLTTQLEQVALKTMSLLSDEGGEKALFIDNSGIPAQTLLQHSKPMSVGMTIYRL